MNDKPPLTSHRQHAYEGPVQDVHVTPGHSYNVIAYVKLLTETAGSGGETLKVIISVQTLDETHYLTAAEHTSSHVSDGWTRLSGQFTVPSITLVKSTFKVEGPRPGIEFLVDDVSMTEVVADTTYHWRNATDSVIDRIRKSDIHAQMVNTGNYNLNDVTVQVVQTSKSFPFGTAVKADQYNENAVNGKYRDFIHQHFNWAVLANALKWPGVEHTQGHYNFQRPLDAVHGLKSHGLKVRGHNLVWSVEHNVPGWVKALSGNTLRQTVQHHIEQTMNETRGLLEHWDVNNENLHGQWYQNTLHDPDYDLELFRIAHHNDPNVKLFLNDYHVVSTNQLTHAYLKQAQRFKAANVGLYGMGAQCHFPIEQRPDPHTIKANLDILARAGVPIWVTELDAVAADENKRADYYEIALRCLYGHPAVEGIIFWGFWGKVTWRGAAGSLVTGDNFEITAAGRRVLDLLENQWMTDETHMLSQSRETFTMRGFHGDYEVRVHYQGQELTNARKTFTLGKNAEHVTVTLL